MKLTLTTLKDSWNRPVISFAKIAQPVFSIVLRIASSPQFMLEILIALNFRIYDKVGFAFAEKEESLSLFQAFGVFLCFQFPVSGNLWFH